MRILIGTAALVTILGGFSPIVAAEKPVQLAAICFKSGEQTSGMNKVCYYDCMGSQVAKTIGLTQLCPLNLNNGSSNAPAQRPSPPSTMCFKNGEWTTGMTKQCSYDCLGSQRVVTLNLTQLCPLNIRQ